MLRYQSDGSLDTDFGDQGFAAITLPGYAGIHDVILQPDGKLLIVGHATTGSIEGYSVTDAFLARFHSNGSIDEASGEHGSIVLRVTDNSDSAESVFLQPDEIVVAGNIQYLHNVTDNTDDTWDVFVARFQEDGSPIRSFGEAGAAEGEPDSPLPIPSGLDRVANEFSIHDIVGSRLSCIDPNPPQPPCFYLVDEHSRPHRDSIGLRIARAESADLALEDYLSAIEHPLP